MIPGDRLGGYDVLGLLGRGGMGEVYRARDTALGRDVALKILPDAFAHDPERLARFQREAHVLASLNHPNIAQIYGLERQGATPALVMELVEGPTLADRIARGPIPYEESLPIARQIADALEAAHEQGVIHRDLKPANVKVRDDGTVKVLDFGLAKALEPVQGSGPTAQAEVTHSPTITSPMTAHGVILGTAAYMAPEQARGKAADRRADIWAFGCVLFEMLSGTRAFEGDEVSDTLAAILRGDPDWQRLPSDVPPTLLVFLKRCLEKDPRRRVRDIGDVRLALAGAFDTPASPTPLALVMPSRWRTWTIAAGCLLIGGMVAGIAVWSLRRPPAPAPAPVTRFGVVVEPARSIPSAVGTPLAITSDGQRLVFSASENASSASGRLYTRSIDQMATLVVSGIEAAVGSLFVSPDSQWIGFHGPLAAGGTALQKVPMTGGTATTLAKGFTSFGGASWSTRGIIAFSVNGGLDGIQLISEAGGAIRRATTPTEGSSHIHPHFLPDGERLLFTRAGSGQPPVIVALNTRTGDQKDLIPGTFPRYVDSGHLVFGRDTVIWATRFDLATLDIRGEPVRVLDEAAPGRVTVSRNGTLAYVPRSEVSGTTMVWVDRSGTVTRLPVDPADYWHPRLSPDGRRLAVGIGPDLWVIDLERGGRTRLTFGQTARLFPYTWTPDGRDILFASPAPSRISRVAANGSGKPTVVLEGKFPQWPADVSPDGHTIAYYVNSPGSLRDLWTVASGGATPTLFLGTQFQERAPRFSPDGRWIAYVSNESGRDEVYLRPYPGPGGQITISTDGGTQPVWSRTTRELFFRSGTAMMAVGVETGATFSASAPRRLFEGEEYVLDMGPGGNPHYDAHPDGKRFLMLIGVPAAAEARVVLNWFEELKRLMPAE